MTWEHDYIDVRLTDDQALVLAPAAYEGRQDRWVIPAGFWTDFGSIPSWLQGVVQKIGKGTLPFIWHDFFCESRKARYGKHGSATWSRFHAIGAEPVDISAVDTDGVLRRLLRERGVGLVGRWLVWAAVRWAALSSDYRREDWLSTLPRLALVTVLALPLPAFLAASLVRGIVGWFA